MNHYCIKGWRETRAIAEERGYFTEAEAYKASRWDQCAVGEARTLFPGIVALSAVSAALGPQDSQLLDLGYEFADAVAMASEDPLDEEGNSIVGEEEIKMARVVGFAKAAVALDGIEARLKELDERASA